MYGTLLNLKIFSNMWLCPSKLKNSSCWSEELYDLNFYVNPIWQLHRKRYWDNNAEFEIDYNSWLWLMIYKIFILHAWRLGVEIIFASLKQVHSFLSWYDCWPNDVKYVALGQIPKFQLEWIIWFEFLCQFYLSVT